MPNYFLNLPAAQMPANAMLDVSGVSNALSDYVRQKNQNRQFDMQDRQFGLQEEQLGLAKNADARQGQQAERQQMEFFGKSASAIARMQDPAQRAMAWQNVVKRHPNAASLPPEYLDPMRGPEAVAAEFGQYRDPRQDQAMDLDMQYKRAQIGKIGIEANRLRDGAGSYGKTGAIFQGPDGGFYTMQFDDRGNRKVAPVMTPDGKPMTPARGVKIVGDEAIDGATAAPIRNIAPQLANAEAAKQAGKDRGAAANAIPKIENTYKQVTKYIDAVLNDKNLDKMLGVRGYLPNVSPQARGLQSRVDQLTGQAFLQAFESLKGAGQITEVEGAKATAALGRFQEMKQSGADYREALRDFKEEVGALRRVAYQRARGVQVGAPAAQGAQPAPAAAGWSIKRLD